MGRYLVAVAVMTLLVIMSLAFAMVTVLFAEEVAMAIMVTFTGGGWPL